MGTIGLWVAFLGLNSAAPLCNQAFPKVGASFDLSPLILGSGFNYQVKDSEDSVERNYSYVFNVCDKVGHSPDPLCNPKPNEPLAPAYQISEDEFCYRLGEKADNMDWLLVDEDDPTVGVSVTYTGGDECPEKLSRKLTVKFLCSTELGMSPFSMETVTENKCHYSLTVNTVFGCPMECHIGGNRQLCGGNGFCGMDDDKNVPRCFCYEGWLGPACEIPNNGWGGGLDFLGIILVIMIILLSALLVAAIWLYSKVHKLRRKKLYEMTDVDSNSHTVFSIEDEDI
jgi:hypothetical protein